MTKPLRIQRKRTKGWNMQETSRAINGLECVYVGRPTIWGNPFFTTRMYVCWIAKGTSWLVAIPNRESRAGGRQVTELGKLRAMVLYNLQQLRGKNLACWCQPEDRCHADILLELANREG